MCVYMCVFVGVCVWAFMLMCLFVLLPSGWNIRGNHMLINNKKATSVLFNRLDRFKSLSLDFLSFQITVHLETWTYPYCTDTAWAILYELAYIHTVAYNPGPNCKISVYWEISHVFYFTTIIHEGVFVSRVESGGEF